MMHRFARASALACVVLFLPACFGLGAKAKAPKPNVIRFPRDNASDGTPKEPRLVGQIAMVNEEDRFVLITCDAWKPPQQGTALKAMRSGTETGILNVNAERRGTYVTADIVTGTPSRGDQVFQ
jgi:hypothetical protein